MEILETERLTLREMDADKDSAFIFELLNTPKFIKFIGDRGVRSIEAAGEFIENRYRQSYRDHGYGMYTVVLKTDEMQIGACGFVRRDSLPGPDIGFSFLPQYERKGYGFESAAAVMNYGRDNFGFERVLAITSQDNDASGKLLEKLGFSFDRLIEMPPNDEVLKLFSVEF